MHKQVFNQESWKSIHFHLYKFYHEEIGPQNPD